MKNPTDEQVIISLAVALEKLKSIALEMDIKIKSVGLSKSLIESLYKKPEKIAGITIESPPE
jgi:hypothetical protein